MAAHPGIHRQALATRAGLSLSAASHHLRVLEERGLILAQHGPKAVHHYASRGPPLRDDRGRHALISLARKRAVAEAVASRPGSIRAELAEAVGISRSTLSWHVQRLIEEGLLEERVGSRGRRELLPTVELLRFLAPWQRAAGDAGRGSARVSAPQPPAAPANPPAGARPMPAVAPA